MRKRIILLTIALISAQWCMGFAQEKMKKVAQSKMQFLKLGIGGRAPGMGDAFVAFSGDPNLIFYNPAGCASIPGLNFAFNQTNWIADIDHKSGVLTYNTGRYGVFILDYISVDYGTMVRTVVDAHSWAGYIKQGEFSVGEYAVGVGYATSIIDRFFIGGQVKYANQDLASSRVWENLNTQFEVERQNANVTDAVAYDFGTYYNAGFKNVRIGMSVQNFANKPLPLTFLFGAAIDLNEFVQPNSKHVLTAAFAALHPKDYSERINFGLEYVYSQTFALRGGYKVNYDLESFSGGFGLNLKIKGMGTKFDYAFSDLGPFGMVNRFSVGLQL